MWHAILININSAISILPLKSLEFYIEKVHEPS